MKNQRREAFILRIPISVLVWETLYNTKQKNLISIARSLAMYPAKRGRRPAHSRRSP
jgi:hypothetical protein